MSDKDIIPALQDAGCSETETNQFLRLNSQNPADAIRFLKCRRCLLLEDIHGKERQIDRLDELVRTLTYQGRKGHTS